MPTVIGLVSYPFLPARVGGQRGVALFYKYFSRWCPVVCVTTRKNDPAAAEGYAVLNILSNSKLRYINPRYYFVLRRIIREYQAGVLILDHPYYGWLGVLLRWTCPIRLVIRSHNLEGRRWRTQGKWWWWILWLYERWVHRRADLSTFIQEEDKAYAIRRYALKPERCTTITYGLERDHAPSSGEVARSREIVRSSLGLAEDETLLFFNGAFDHAPNREALEYIVREINPLLQQMNGFRYRILICGKGIPEAISKAGHPNMLFAGYVEDIDRYFRGADVFINPVITGGGIKTKLVEALGNNLTAVSVRSGATGIDPAWTNGKLLVVEDGDWPGFVRLIAAAREVRTDIPPVYF
ncbi:MAG TPA: glycosyltransferase, partial [Puia sp.]|nr:glycosyltransferase [Puia sp.]